MARFDTDFSAAGEVSVDLDELIAALRVQQEAAATGTRSRHGAIACYLSASEGWRDALADLGGNFSGDVSSAAKERPQE